MTKDTAIQYPHFAVDHHADAVYITLNDMLDQVHRTEPITPHINADYDAFDRVIGLEFLSVKVDFGEEFKFRMDAQ